MTDPSLVTPSEPPANRRLRVLTLVDGMGMQGGGESLAREITLRLDPQRFEPTFCVSRWDPEAFGDEAADAAIGELHQNGVAFLGLQRAGRPAVRAWAPLVSALRTQPFDVLHSHKFGSNVWAALLAGVGRVPVFVAHEHTWSFEGRPASRFLDRQLIGRGHHGRRRLERRPREDDQIEGLARRRCCSSRTASPIPCSRPGPGGGRGSWASRRRPLIGAVATIRPQKRLDVLVDAAARLERATLRCAC